jgi:DNA-directed RNA polymerase II subunit RPB2
LQSDKDILEHIVYSFEDHEMMEALRPSIEEAQPINTQELALDYIGKRASQVCLTDGSSGPGQCNGNSGILLK